MRCDWARELMLTDYMDSEPDYGTRHEVDEHLRRCAACREFHELANEKITRQFVSARDEDPSESIWNGIREKIVSNAGVSSGILSDATEGIRLAFSQLLSMPRPVAVLAAGFVIVVLLLTAAPGIQRRALDEYLNNQIDFIANLDAGQTNETGIFDTDIRIDVDNLL